MAALAVRIRPRVMAASAVVMSVGLVLLVNAYAVTDEESRRFALALGVLALTGLLLLTPVVWLVWEGLAGRPRGESDSGAWMRAPKSLLRPAPVVALILAAITAPMLARALGRGLGTLLYPSLGPLWSLAVPLAALVAGLTWAYLLVEVIVVAAGPVGRLGSGAAGALRRSWQRDLAITREPFPSRAAGYSDGRDVATGLPSPAWVHVVVLGLVAAVGLVTYRSVLATAALDWDNLQVLSSVDLATPLGLFVEPTWEAAPIYRPLAYLSVWAQYELTGVAPVPFFAVNGVLCIGCAALAYALGWRLTASWAAAAGAALLLLVDDRMLSALFLIGARTQSMAALFGLGALQVAYRGLGGPRRAARLAAVFALLLAAALSKEYGLAASGGVLVLALLGRREDRRGLAGAALAAPIVYAAVRLAATAGAESSPFCEDMALLYVERTVCYGEAVRDGELVAGVDRVVQYVWNICAAALATVLPFLIAPVGTLRTLGEVWKETPALSLVTGAVFFLAAVTAWVARPRHALPLLAVVLGNAALSFLIYRDRNLLPGVAAFYVSSAVGVAVIGAWLRAWIPSRHLAVATAARYSVALAGVLLLAAAATSSSVALSSKLSDFARTNGDRYPCETPEAGRPLVEGGTPDITEKVIRESRAYYGTTPGCPNGAD